MTTENRALLEAIRIIVGEAIAPLSTRVDGLSERYDDLSRQFTGQSARLDGLFEHVGGLTMQLDMVIERTDRIEAEQRMQRELLQRMDALLTTLEDVTRRLEAQAEVFEIRMAQLATNIRDVLDQQETMNKSLRTLRREVEYAIIQTEELRDQRSAYQLQLRQLEERIEALEQRMSRLDNTGSTL